SVIQPVIRRQWRRLRSVHWITLDRTVGQTERKRRVRIYGLSVNCKPRLGDLFSGAGDNRLHTIFVLLASLAEEWIHIASQDNKRISACAHRRVASLHKTLTYSRICELSPTNDFGCSLGRRLAVQNSF